MLFNSPEFIFLFLPVTLITFFALGKLKFYRGAIVTLTSASLFFYGWWNPPYLGLLLFSIGFNYCLGSLLSKRVSHPISRKLLLWSGVGVNLLLIGYFKYANFFLDTVNQFFQTQWNLNQVILPLAISFFTFQQIAYLVDAYRGETKEYHFLDYCLFVSFFPQLIAGPIVHHQEIMPQFREKETYQVSAQNLAIGLTIFTLGLAKKIFLADTFATYATPVFTAADGGELLTFYEAWCAAIAYSLQLYFDFSGYSEMAIGVARMFGIKLPLNFNSPYKSISITHFWRRWHITLSNFLRDYIYIVLGGNRKGELRKNMNLMTTMLLGGLWHGAGWTFVFWGGLHGFYLIVNNQWVSLQKRFNITVNNSAIVTQFLGCSITFFFVAIGWVFFRAESMAGAISILKAMFGSDGFILSAPHIRSDKLMPAMLAVGLCIVWFAPNVQEWIGKYQAASNVPQLKEKQKAPVTHHLWKRLQWQPNLFWSAAIGITIFLVSKTFLTAQSSEFLYFNF